jgi:dihydroorotate dehydrogenase electron transfer subunit
MVGMYDDIVAVIENRPLTGGHFLLSLDAPLRMLGRSDVLLRRPMSIYDVRLAFSRNGKERLRRAPGLPRYLQLLYKVVGRGTRLMVGLKPGDRVGLLGPLGHGFFEEDYLPRAHGVDEILHVAGGIGIAALLLPAKRLREAGFHQRLFFGGRTKADLVSAGDFKPLMHATLLATEDGSAGYRGFVTRPLEEYLSGHTGKRFLLMACGPEPMLRATAELAKRYRHPCLVSMENRMGCGLGVCLGCCIRVEGTGHEAYQRVCTEGPVFWADKVIWKTDRQLGIRE